MEILSFIIAMLSFFGAYAIVKHDATDPRSHWELFYTLALVCFFSTLVGILSIF
jgi:hypothetical protein